MKKEENFIHGTTIIAVKKGEKVAIAGDGQVTLQNTVLKHTAKKVRRVYNDKVIVGFAGATADAFALLDRFQNKLEEYHGNLKRASVELAKEWRMDKYLRHLSALMIAVDKNDLLLISGTGDIIESEDGILAIGSGGPYAQAAAKALMRHTNLDVKSIALESIKIASEICIYTNNEISIDFLE